MRFTIKLKLTLAFAFLIVALAGVAGLGISSLSSMKANMDEVINVTAMRLDKIQELDVLSLTIIRAQKNAILSDTIDEARSYISASEDAHRSFVQKRKMIARSTSSSWRVSVPKPRRSRRALRAKPPTC
jgi:methyl-accepting chemotaxis protein